jgi:hypothetical protein
VSVKNVASNSDPLSDAALIALPALAREARVTLDAVKVACGALGIVPSRTPSKRQMVSITAARRIYLHVRPGAP